MKYGVTWYGKLSVKENRTMSFEIFTDSSANLTQKQVEENGLKIISLTFSVNGEERLAYDPTDSFDLIEYYKKMKEEKLSVKTSLINFSAFIDAFTPCLEEGKDILYVAMSSGISGTYQASVTAAEILAEKYPERKVVAFDTRAASFGEGIFALEAARLRAEGKDLDSAVKWINDKRMNMCQFFTVDDLMFLRRGGRLGTISAVLGTIINIKPVLMGDHDGKIVVCEKIRGRQKSLIELADLFTKKAINSESQTIAVAHCGCPEDAEFVVSKIREKNKIKDAIIEYYEPGTGAHVGPGTVALFFWGDKKEI